MVRFYRNNVTIVLKINSKLGTCRPVYSFEFCCGNDQEHAELATRNFNKIMENFLNEIAEEWYQKGWKDAKAKRAKEKYFWVRQTLD